MPVTGTGGNRRHRAGGGGVYCRASSIIVLMCSLAVVSSAGMARRPRAARSIMAPQWGQMGFLDVIIQCNGQPLIFFFDKSNNATMQ